MRAKSGHQQRVGFTLFRCGKGAARKGSAPDRLLRANRNLASRPGPKGQPRGIWSEFTIQLL
jgi:hypothetical protein